MKVKLTEEQFKNIIKRELDDVAFLLNEGNLTSKDIDAQKNVVMQNMLRAYQQNKPIGVDDAGNEIGFADRMSKIGDHIGVNYAGSKQAQLAQQKMAQVQSENPEETIREFVKKLVEVAEYIRNNNLISANGVISNKIYKAYGVNNAEENAAFIMKCKDVMDLLGLNWLYLPQSSWSANANKHTSQLVASLTNEILSNENVTEKVFNFLKSDFGEYLKGTRVKSFAEKYGVDGKADLLKDPNIKKEIELEYYKHLTNKMFGNVYGMELDMPSDIFTLGNNKLAKDTLVINFTSAHRCPAWNNCLVKNSCYAKSSEHGYRALFAKNKQMTMMWEASQYDSEILESLKTLIRMFVVNLSKMRKYIKTPINTDADFNMVAEDTQQSGDDYCLSLIRKGFDKMPSQYLDMIKNPDYGIKRANYVRLNEEGDFIGQWLVDAIDIFAGELKLIDVYVTAYTCRLLNFNGIKNIILNTSRANITGNMARRFYAIPEEMYDKLDETYTNMEFASEEEFNARMYNNGMPTTKAIYPTIINGKLIPYPQPAYNLEGAMEEGMYYYKCPCGREKLNEGSNKKDADGQKIGCYECRMCYEQKNSISDKPIVVYVKVHSTEKDMFNFQTQKDTVYSKNYNGEQINEEVEYNENENLAIQQIANNAIESVNNHLTNMTQQKLEEQRIKDKFWETLNKL